MDGSYGNVFRPGRSHMSPNAPVGDNNTRYKTNVSRQKTKKWVEAKIQSYDGDDWGNEYDEDAEDEPEEPVPPLALRATAPHSPGMTSSQQPPAVPRHFRTATAPVPSFASRAASSSPALHLQTQKSFPVGLPSQAEGRTPSGPQSAGPAPARYPLRKSSLSQQDTPDFADTKRTMPASDTRRNMSVSLADASQNPRVETPPAPEGMESADMSTRPSPSARPADASKRIDDRQGRERQGGLEPAGWGRGGGLAGLPSRARPEQTEPGRPMVRDAKSPSPTPHGPQGEAPSAAERRSEYGLESLIASYGSPEPTSPAGADSGSSQAGPVPMGPEIRVARAESQPEIDRRRLSTSPKLPDLARLSAFGIDLFSKPSSAPPAEHGASLSVRGTDAGFSEPGHPGAATVAPLHARDRAASHKAPISATTSPAETEQQHVSGAVPPGDAGSPCSAPVDAASRGAEKLSLDPARLPSPGPLPPLRTSSPLHPTRGAPEDEPGKDSAVAEMKDAGPATAQSDISTPAPLNINRASIAAVDIVLSRPDRFSTTSTNTTASPAKESDKLREEIIRSLSPMRSGSDFGDATAVDAPNTSLGGDGRGARESTYPHDVYDDYWTPGDEQAEHTATTMLEDSRAESLAAANHDSLQSPQASAAETRSLPPPSQRADSPQDEPRLGRRRFSWEVEAEGEGGGGEGGGGGGGGGGDEGGVKRSASPSRSGSAAKVTLYGSEPSNDAVSTAPDAESSSSSVKPSPTAASYQRPQSSTHPDGAGSVAPLRSPSSASAESATRPMSMAEVHRLSLAEEKMLAEELGTTLFPGPDPEQHPAVSQAPPAPPPPPPESGQATAARREPVNTVAFKQILGMQTPAERIKLFNETREQFLSLDSGLGEWMLAMTSQYPEYADATWRFADPAGGGGATGAVRGSKQTGQQQSHHQQYLSASSSSLVGGQGAKPATNGPSPLQHGPGGLGHSGNQVGTKSKELLMTAGKVGRGLLSKGRSKLRTTGDKVFH